jgi:opacity protein-like surface antigen
VGGYGGYRFSNGIRIEGEVTYRRNELDKLKIDNDAGVGVALGVGSLNGLTADADGDVSSVSFMANAWFEPQVGKGLLPYVGGGIGGTHVSADASVLGVTIVDDSDTVLSGQVGAGLGYAVTPNIVVGADYRFLMSADPSFEDEAGGSFDSEYMTHNIMVGVRGHF